MERTDMSEKAEFFSCSFANLIKQDVVTKKTNSDLAEVYTLG